MAARNGKSMMKLVRLPTFRPLLLTPHENLALTNFDSHEKCIKVGPLSLTHESKVLSPFWHWLWHNFDLHQSYHAFNASQTWWAKVPLMHALGIIIFDKTFDHFGLESKVYHIWLKSKVAFDSRQIDRRYGQIWPLTPVTNVEGVVQRQFFVQC